MDTSRRGFFKSTARSSELRPPWLLNPATFTETCTRCNQCVTLCPQDILCAGDGGFPRVDFSQAECTFCGECASDCEAQLFQPAVQIKIGNTGWSHTAEVAQHCLAYSGVMCRSCEDACEPQAIRFPLTLGKVPRPVVDTDACTGCGACVRPCPEDAITMTGQTE